MAYELYLRELRQDRTYKVFIQSARIFLGAFVILMGFGFLGLLEELPRVLTLMLVATAGVSLLTYLASSLVIGVRGGRPRGSALVLRYRFSRMVLADLVGLGGRSRSIG
ncbi:hypothetical protein ACIBF5_02150 [Micromonospora sp. NPDC050417]|uniref:hypothetical protein n=1 Tax=Micromonospora sp. NPDC050417 TaxID=3364280 RepID=UPI0037B59A2E